MVAVMGDAPVLVAVKEGILPLPLAARPIDVLLFVHANVAPEGVLLKVLPGTEAPSQTLLSEGAVATGIGFTVTFTVPAGLVQPETVTVTE